MSVVEYTDLVECVYISFCLFYHIFFIFFFSIQTRPPEKYCDFVHFYFIAICFIRISNAQCAGLDYLLDHAFMVSKTLEWMIRIWWLVSCLRTGWRILGTFLGVGDSDQADDKNCSAQAVSIKPPSNIHGLTHWKKRIYERNLSFSEQFDAFL